MNEDSYAYLRDGFNARTLRKDQLRNILLTHEVEYTNDMLKPQLLELFQSEIVPRRAELRSKFVDVAASGANIEEATPPQAERAPRLAKTDAQELVNESPRSRRARSRSPRRVASAGRKNKEASKEAAQPDLQAVPDLQKGDLPDLAPPSSALEPPKSPKSPRRRRVNRKVEISEPEPETLNTLTEDIKVKVPRSPRRKRRREEDEEQTADESFSSSNVFQGAKSASKKRRAESPNPQPPKSELNIASNLSALSNYDIPSEQLSSMVSHAPLTEADINIDALPLDPDFVADLNAEVDRLQDSADIVAQLESQPSSSFPRDENRLQLETGLLPEPEISEQQPQEYSQASRPNATPRRRGFIPSLAELSVSRAFAEQLEPFMVPSPTPTPRASLAPETPTSNRPNSIVAKKPKSETPVKRDSSIELPDAEKVAAEDLNDAVADAVKWYHKISLPKLHLPELPHPHIRAPPLPRLRAPQLRRPGLPGFLTHRPSLPRQTVPCLKRIGFVSFVILSVLLNTGLITLGVLLALWYRDALANAEFCGVGARAPHLYPQWTLYDTGYPLVGDLQTSFREMMDEVWPECIACPQHAHCYQDQILLCENGYRLATHPLALGGVLPYPPRCLPDWEAQRKLDVLSERAASYLREKRASVLCDAPNIEEENVEEFASIHADELRSRLSSEKSSQLSDAEFDLLWQQVIEELPNKHADVYVVSFDPTSTSTSFLESPEEETGPQKYISRKADGGQLLTDSQNADDNNTAHSADSATSPSIEERDAQDVRLASRSDVLLPFKCRFRRYVAKWFHAHRDQFIYAVSSILIFGFSFIVITRSRAQRRRQGVIVESFISQLKRQRALADADPSGKTVPYLRAADLRKQVGKSQLKTIQDLLESVEGVRMRQIEIYGEITRIWEWTP